MPQQNFIENAYVERERQRAEQYMSMSPEQRDSIRKKAFETEQSMMKDAMRASDPNASKGMDPYQREKMLGAANNMQREDNMQLIANAGKLEDDAYARSMDQWKRQRQMKQDAIGDMQRQPGTTGNVTFTNPGTAARANPTQSASLAPTRSKRLALA